MNSNAKLWSKDFTEKRKLSENFYSYIFKIVSKNVDGGCISWLDVGCGDGRILIPLAQKFYRTQFFGVDKNEVMIKNLNKILRKKDIHNVMVKLQSAESFLKKFQLFNIISFFQSIHFFNTRDILNSTCKRLQKNGLIIIATTTHEQFKSIPYSKNKIIRNIEIKRTPDWKNIVDVLKTKKLRLIAERDFSVFRYFRNSAELKNYLLTMPYSAFTRIDKPTCLEIIEEITTQFNLKKDFKFFVDKFKVGIFKSYE